MFFVMKINCVSGVAKSEPAKSEPAKSEPAKSEPAERVINCMKRKTIFIKQCGKFKSF